MDERDARRRTALLGSPDSVQEGSEAQDVTPPSVEGQGRTELQPKPPSAEDLPFGTSVGKAEQPPEVSAPAATEFFSQASMAPIPAAAQEVPQPKSPRLPTLPDPSEVVEGDPLSPEDLNLPQGLEATSKEEKGPPSYVLTEIAQLIQRELARYGVPGDVKVVESEIHHRAGDAQEPLKLGGWVKQWPLTSQSERLRITADLAREIASKKQNRPAQSRTRLHFDAPTIAAGAVLVLIVALFFWLSPDSPDSADDSTQRESSSELTSAQGSVSDTERVVPEERASRVCAATKARIHQGGSVTVADVDGWRVEIALLKHPGTTPLHNHPSLREFVQEPGAKEGSEFIWSEEANLASIATSDSKVQVQRIDMGNAGKHRVQGVILSFGGTLADAYFSKQGRARYFHIANSLTDKLQATHTAVYARCFDDQGHAMGSWFRGKDTAGVSASLLYFMGSYATPLHLSRPFTRQPGTDQIDRHFTFLNISKGTEQLDRSSLATLVGSEGGMATGKEGESVVITFPFRDGNRASRLSRSLARVTSLAR